MACRKYQISFKAVNSGTDTDTQTPYTMTTKGLKKDVVMALSSRLKRLESIGTYRKELSGIKGSTEKWHGERSSIVQHLFGVPQTLKNQELFDTEYTTFLDTLPGTITEDNMAIVVLRADTIFNAHLIIEDNRKTQEEVDTQTKSNNEAQVKRDEKQAVKMVAEEKESIELLKEFGHMKRYSAGDNSSHALTSSNIKKHLKKQYPGHKFSVKSQSYSGGSSVNVSWTDGPSYTEVDEFVDRFQYNGVMDNTDHVACRTVGNAFRSLFGSVGYASCNRTVNEERYTETATNDMGWCPEDLVKLREEPQHLNAWRRELHTKVQETSFYKGNPEGENSEKSLIEDSGTATVNTATTKRGTEFSGVSITKNPDKGGIEIQFANKPGSDVLLSLCAQGFRYSRRLGWWYAQDTSTRWTFAQSLTGPSMHEMCV